ncbi:multidrug resistance-associated protein 1 [Aplysia californica]|uniref:ABC-type glutathione-S-conjugate transporter n=1 Tax=Aplysia californica TaxID=6500 RepID=A0ABM0JBS0_APLCA|nr:multidrug resistance-associated protein 1 [Aplysia californica]XP_005090016.1 multidrug resistance-associated protein 1 [Aplysia californica]XP_005090017.1 multidrug resistance-associated protein 1 [Aplysia californica]
MSVSEDCLQGFCDDPFWDVNLTWYQTWPQMTSCFQDTVLVWVPCGFLWLAAPFYTAHLAGVPSAGRGASFTPLFVAKLAGLVLLLMMSVVDVVSAINENDRQGISLLKANVFAAALLSVTLLLALLFVIAERRKRFVTSGVMFIFWLLLTICNIVPFYSYIEEQIYDSDVFEFSIFYIQFAFIVTQLLLHCWAEKPVLTYASPKKPSPELGASFPSRLTFWWLNKLMLQGYKTPITESVMCDLHPRDKCESVVPRFLQRWIYAVRLKKVKTAVRSQMQVNSFYSGNVNAEPVSERTPLIRGQPNGSLSSENQKSTKVKRKKSGPSLVGVLFKTFWMEYFLSQIWKLFYDVLVLCNPLLLGELVTFVQDPKEQAWKGYILALGLFFSTCLQTLLFHQVFHLSTSLGLRIRASVISSVFRKALTMDNAARKESTIGEVVNLMSVDAEHLENIMSYLWAIWSSPLQILVSLYLLYDTVGLSMFAGAAFLIFLIPANGVITAKLGTLQTQLMACKDERMKVMNELLSGIKIVKLFAWEKSFKRRVLEVRDAELSKLRTGALLTAILTFSWTAAPFVVSLLTFLCYVFTSNDHYLDPKKAFVAISLFDILRYAINFAPMIVSDLIKAVISARRIGHFLYHDDLDKNSVSHFENAEHAITITNGSFSWNEETGETLKNINVKIPDGELVAVVGTVGSGKSSLLAAMLGDLDKTEGSVNVRGTLAYVPQQAWIQNDTVRNNILFGRPMDKALYDRCVEACALTPDLDILPAGDLTEIGERGINLSGGQKQRVSLARAVYSQADVYLLDDPLSAVDSHVGRHIFDHVMGPSGMLHSRVRVLVTHGIQYLPYTDHVIVVTGGRVSEAGHYEKLLTHNGPFAQVIRMFLAQGDGNENANSDEIEVLKREVLRRLSETEDDDDGEVIVKDARDILRQLSVTSHSSEKKENKKEETPNHVMLRQQSHQATLIEEETVGTGTVKMGVFREYARSVGYFSVFIIVLLYACYSGSDLGSLIFLSSWTDDLDLANFTLMPSNSSERSDRNNFYIGIYGLFGVLQTIFIMAFAVTQSLRAVHASRVLHSSMLSRVLRAPMAFFDTTPVGRIMNRFSKDMDDVDEEIPMTFVMWVDCIFMVLSTIVVISYSTPLFLAFMLPVALLYFFVQRFYIATSRQLKRLESKTRSPIFNHFSETLTGASVIRAFGAENRFVLESESKVDSNQIFSFSNFCVNRWLGIRLEFVGNIILLLAATIAVATKDSITGGVMGLSITYALSITENLNWLVRMTGDLETQIVSVERIKEYTELTTEAAWECFSHRSPLGWPQEGHIKFENLSLRYRDGLDLVLKAVSFDVQPGEKVGIVGRTGAGKSSLTLALFRLVEPAGGRILIDGIDIGTLGLHDLRAKVTILPQDPVIFAGSLRMNLDPFEEYGEHALWTALEHAHLKDFVEGLPNKLEHECGEGGENLSVGQRQLLCLARALLLKTKILILDEATAAVDMETDEVIQTTIREEFSHCSILTIAHRLNTVMDYDKILVLDKGEVMEFDNPQILLQRPDSLFYSMAESAGLVGASGSRS